MDRKPRLEHTGRRAVWLVLAVAAAGAALVVLLVVPSSVRLANVSPADGDQDVPITAPVRLAFSHAMDTDSVEARLRIEPEVMGGFEWDGKEVTFLPRVALAPETTYTVTLEVGAVTPSGRALNQEHTWRFRTRSPRLLFLGRPAPEEDVRQLFAASFTTLSEEAPVQLTRHAGGVWDYAVHLQGEAIAFTVLREDGGADLWRMERDGGGQQLLLACPDAACLNPAWSPDGQQLAYERRDIWAAAPNLDPKAARIWLLDLATGEERPLFDYDVPLHSPVWSPSGDRLAYISPLLPGVEIYDLGSGELQQFANDWGAVPVWSPDGRWLVMPEIVLAGEELLVRLFRVDPEEEQAADISGDEEAVRDESPAWSPGGGWIAFGRRFLDQERWTPGRQIWLTRPNGSEAYPLLRALSFDHFAYTWRPDGAALAYLRTNMSDGPQPVPEVSVWVFDLVARESVLVAAHGVLPRWLP
jgi:Tol biopolymer transport system component